MSEIKENLGWAFIVVLAFLTGVCWTGSSIIHAMHSEAIAHGAAEYVNVAGSEDPIFKWKDQTK